MRLPLVPGRIRIEKTTIEIIQFNEFGEVEYKDTKENVKCMVYDEQLGWISGRSEGVTL